MGPQLWGDAGRIYLPARLPFVLKCSYWEYLFLWGNALVGGIAGKGLIENQIFAQWIHSVLGLGGSVLVLNAIFREIAPAESEGQDSRFWRLLALCAAISSSLLDWTSWLAKNDYGSILWTFSGFLVLLDVGKKTANERRRFWIAGFFFGAAAVVKFTTLFLSAPLFLVWFFSGRARPRGLGLWFAPFLGAALGAAAALSPWLLRNGLWTGNPFFPYFSGHFHSDWLSQSSLDLMKIYEGGVPYSKMQLLSDRLHLFVRREPLAAALPFLLLAMRVLAPRRRSILFWYSVCPCAAFVLLAAFAGPPPGADDGTFLLRYLGPALMFGLGCAVFALRGLASPAALKNPGFKTIVAVVIGSLTLWRTSEPVAGAIGVPSAIPQATYALRTMAIGGEIKAWLRLNASLSDLIVSTGENQFYYVSYLNITDALTQPYLNRITSAVSRPDDAVRILYDEGVRYAVDIRHFTREGRWGVLSDELIYEAYRHPDAIAFAGADGFIADVPKLYGDIFQQCPVIQAADGGGEFLFHILVGSTGELPRFTQ